MLSSVLSYLTFSRFIFITYFFLWLVLEFYCIFLLFSLRPAVREGIQPSKHTTLFWRSSEAHNVQKNIGVQITSCVNREKRSENGVYYPRQRSRINNFKTLSEHLFDIHNVQITSYIQKQKKETILLWNFFLLIFNEKKIIRIIIHFNNCY